MIAQATLRNGHWFGRADVLRRVDKPSAIGPWSYEVSDCKLARDTKAGTILQLSLYSELLEKVQGVSPEFMYVVPRTENFEEERYRVLDYAAYFRQVKARLERAVEVSGTPRARTLNQILTARSAAGARNATHAGEKTTIFRWLRASPDCKGSNLSLGMQILLKDLLLFHCHSRRNPITVQPRVTCVFASKPECRSKVETRAR